ncbi:MAG: NAD(P)/FAD-dependent oxidoreductase [Pseudolabrys sp.]
MATDHRDLRTGRTVWQDAPLPDIPLKPAAGTIEADVLIVGAGITGATVADALTEAGLNVAIAERRKPLCGSTMATTALIQFELDTPLIDLGKQIGEQRAQRAWLRSKRGVEALARRAKDIECDWKERATLYLAGNQLGGKALQEEAGARDAIGLPAEFIETGNLLQHYGIDNEGAIRSHGNAECNPVLLAGGLLRRAISRGATIYCPVEIVSLQEDETAVVAAAKHGARFKTRALIYATGYEMPDIVPCKETEVNSTWAIATAPQPDRLWPTKALIWEAAKPYLYVRTTPEGRVIAGGEDEEFSDEAARDALIGEKTATIERKLKTLLPQLKTEAEFAWTGSFGSSKTGMPAIGLIPGKSKSYAVLGFGGNGITFGMIAAEIFRAVLSGSPDSDAELFALR